MTVLHHAVRPDLPTTGWATARGARRTSADAAAARTAGGRFAIAVSDGIGDTAAAALAARRAADAAVDAAWRSGVPGAPAAIRHALDHPRAPAGPVAGGAGDTAPAIPAVRAPVHDTTPVTPGPTPPPATAGQPAGPATRPTDTTARSTTRPTETTTETTTETIAETTTGPATRLTEASTRPATRPAGRPAETTTGPTDRTAAATTRPTAAPAADRPAAGDTTFAVAAGDAERGWSVAWVGDCRAYFVPPSPDTAGPALPATADHTIGRYLRDRGVPAAPSLDRVLTTTARKGEPGAAAGPPGPGRLVLVTNGVHHVLDAHAIARIARSVADPARAAGALVTAALDAGGADNAAAAVADLR